jgi:hypothetical protein
VGPGERPADLASDSEPLRHPKSDDRLGRKSHAPEVRAEVAHDFWDVEGLPDAAAAEAAELDSGDRIQIAQTE